MISDGSLYDIATGASLGVAAGVVACEDWLFFLHVHGLQQEREGKEGNLSVALHYRDIHVHR